MPAQDRELSMQVEIIRAVQEFCAESKFRRRTLGSFVRARFIAVHYGYRAGRIPN